MRINCGIGEGLPPHAVCIAGEGLRCGRTARLVGAVGRPASDGDAAVLVAGASCGVLLRSPTCWGPPAGDWSQWSSLEHPRFAVDSS